MLKCCVVAVSGSVPEEPVVDRKTGHLYEKRLVLKYVQVFSSHLYHAGLLSKALRGYDSP